MRAGFVVLCLAAMAVGEEPEERRKPVPFEWRQLGGSATHAVVWERKDAVVVPKVLWHAPEAVGQPTLSGGWLYAGGPVLGRYSPSSGEFEKAPAADARRVGATPVLTDDAVIVRRPGGRIEAYSRDLRKLRWQADTKTPDLLMDDPAAYHGGLYLVSEEGTIRALRVRDGKSAWAFAGDRGQIAMTPAIAEGRVYFGAVGGNFWALELTSGKQIWKFVTFEGSGWSEPVVAGDTLYLSDGGVQYAHMERTRGHLQAIDPHNGRRLWTQPHGCTCTSTPGLGPERIVLGTRKTVMQFNRKTGKELQPRIETDAPALGTPLVTDAALYFGTIGGTLQAHDLRTGALLWQLRIPGMQANKRPHEVRSIVHTGTRIYVETTNGLYCLGQDPQRRGVRPQNLTIEAPE